MYNVLVHICSKPFECTRAMPRKPEKGQHQVNKTRRRELFVCLSSYLALMFTFSSYAFHQNLASKAWTQA